MWELFNIKSVEVLNFVDVFISMHPEREKIIVWSTISIVLFMLLNKKKTMESFNRTYNLISFINGIDSNNNAFKILKFLVHIIS